jgi:hypothetical protein
MRERKARGRKGRKPSQKRWQAQQAEAEPLVTKYKKYNG